MGVKTKTDLEIQKLAVLKVFRSTVRLKHALHADREISEQEPLLLEKIDRALASGEGFEFDPAEVFRAIEG